MASNTPFPEFKTTGDEKQDLEIYIEDLIDYCIMQNWYDTSKETDEAKWTKPDKAMACLRASLSLAARTVYKYSLHGFKGSRFEEASQCCQCVKRILWR